MHSSHPDYTQEPLAHDLRREHLLHRVVAGSAFLFALCILPVSQYFLVQNRQVATKGEVGQVAGVETSAPQVLNAIPTEVPVPTGICADERQKALDDLDRFTEGKRLALTRDYQKVVDPYQAALKAVTGTPEEIASTRASLGALIDQKYQPYLQQLNALNQAVAMQKQQILSGSCPQ